MRLHHHGHPLDLLPDRAVFLPEHSALVLADVHLGKAGAFRAHGLAIPDGDDERDLARITALLTETRAHELVIAGDLFHAPSPALPGLLCRFATWLEACPARVTLVAGNHDRRALRGAPPLPLRQADSLDIGPFRVVHDAALDSGSSPFSCSSSEIAARDNPLAQRHRNEDGDEKEFCKEHDHDDKSAADPSGPVEEGRLLLCGHLHPVIRLRDGRRTSLRSPCFWQAGSVITLPAFGTFTGGQIIHPGPDDGIFLPLRAKVVEAPAACWA